MPQDEVDTIALEWGLTLVQEVSKNVAAVDASDESLEAQMKYVSEPPVIKLSRKYQSAQGLADWRGQVRELAAENSEVTEPGKRTSLKQLSSALTDAVIALVARKTADKAAKLPYSASDMLEELDALAQQHNAEHSYSWMAR